MKFGARVFTSALAATMLTTAVATPAEAQRYRQYERRGDGIGLGDVVLGAIAVAGVATVVGALSDGARRDRYGRRYEGRYAGRYGDSERVSIDACTYAAEREAGRRFGSDARVSIDDVDRRRDGYAVRGVVEVDGGYGGDRYYDRGGYDRRGGGAVAFSCTARYGEVTGLRLGSAYARGY